MRIAILAMAVGGCTGGELLNTTNNGGDGAGDSAAELVDTAWPVASGEDFAYVDGSTGEVRVYFNDEGELENSVGLTWSPPEDASVTLICDADGDGLDDLWLFTASDDLFTVNIYGNQGGAWSATPTNTSTSDRSLDGLQFFCADSDADGRDELFIYKDKNGALLGVPNSGGNLDWSGMVWDTTAFDAESDWLPADYDGDGDDELGVYLDTTLSVWALGGNKLAADSALFEVATSGGSGVAALDVNADGLADVGLWNGTSLVVYAGTGSGIDTATKWVFSVGGSGRSFGADVR